MQEQLHVEAEVKALKEGEFEVIASTFDKDRMGDKIKPDGWVLSNFKKNPVILWAHNNFIPPVGKATKVWIEDKKLKMRGKFADTPLAQELKGLVEGGFLNAVSVGFIPLKEDEKGNLDYEGKMYRRANDQEIKDFWGTPQVFEKQELLEVSWVAVPALPQALVTARSSGKEFGALLTKALDASTNEKKEVEVDKFFEVLFDSETKEQPTEVKEEPKKLEIKSELNTDRDALEKAINALDTASGTLKAILAQTPAPASDKKGRSLAQEHKRVQNPEVTFLRTMDKIVEARLLELRRQPSEN